ncbi:transmembrane emp24 domain-containing protein p24delta9-like isoform X1 [Apium graveolens]|uniref:transmembrane emp24 domain-containing protein p24delta9-like isoform X1 n=1 Tax=Apium graveolens TaxID=4045 RepID=UPI003D792883
MGLSLTESVRFDLESGNTKCISEDIKSNSMTVGSYRIVNPNEPHHFHPSSTEQPHQPLPDSHKLTVRVTATSGNSYHYADHVQNGQFSFQVVEAGDYMACFWAVDQTPPASLTIDFDWKSGVATKDWSNVAKKGMLTESVFNTGAMKKETSTVKSAIRLTSLIRLLLLDHGLRKLL